MCYAVFDTKLSIGDMIAPSRHWRLNDDYLVEETPTGTRLWGRWDCRFGCWNDRGDVIIPAERLLGRLGLWLEPVGEHDDAWHESRAALTAYWTLVPTTARLLAAELEDQQWQALLRIWRSRVLKSVA